MLSAALGMKLLPASACFHPKAVIAIVKLNVDESELLI